MRIEDHLRSGTVILASNPATLQTEEVELCGTLLNPKVEST